MRSTTTLEMLQQWVDWYERQYGPLGLTPGRMLWEQTRELIEAETGIPKKPLPDPIEYAKQDLERLKRGES